MSSSTIQGESGAPCAGQPAATGQHLSKGILLGLSQRGIDLQEEIGRGAASIVYRAADRRHARCVAVKLLSPAHLRGEPDRLVPEIRLTAGLQHPHILPIYESGVLDGTPFYVMPYVEGESLRHRLTSGRLPVREALRIAIEVADALRYAHAHGVVHRDIKPENILLEGGHAVIADFGVAETMSTADAASAGRPLIVGTPAYMSPEQASGDLVMDGRSDLYALACMLYEMLVGEPPFQGPTPQATIARRFLGPPVPVRQRRPEVPDGIAAVVEKALAIDPTDRFPSAADLADALIDVRRKSEGGELGVSRRGQRGFVIGAGLVSLAAAVVLGRDAPLWGPTRLDPRRVAIAALSNETGDSALAPLGRMVASWITDSLARTAGIEEVTSATIVPAQHDQHLAQSDADDPARLQQFADETRAGTLISGSYYRGASGAVEFHVEITDANSGDLLRAIGPITSGPEPERTATDLGRVVAATVDTLVVRKP